MRSLSLIGIGLAMVVSAQPLAAFAAGPRACLVDRIEGVVARYWVSGRWSDLTAGLAVPVEAKIATGTDTRVRIACDDDAVVTIGAGTELNLENLVTAAASRQPVAMQLIQGIIGLFLPQRDRAGFEVRTPVAIASVRSTEWLIEWDPGDAAAIFVKRGSVIVRGPRGEPFLLGDGEGITITALGDAGEVKAWGAPRIAKSAERLGFDWR